MARVLMIEDDLALQGVVRDVLGSSFEVAFADCLLDAIVVIKSQMPDVVLLDLNLPDSRGMATLTSLVNAFPNLPIVVWSGAGEAAEAIRLGADEFILKAGNMEAVHDALTRAIARHPFKSVREDIKTLQKFITKDEETHQ